MVVVVVEGEGEEMGEEEEDALISNFAYKTRARQGASEEVRRVADRGEEEEEEECATRAPVEKEK